MLKNIQEWAQGKKTHITGVMTILGAAVALVLGEITVAEATNLVVTAILGMTIRAGIKSESKKVAEKVDDSAGDKPDQI